LGSGKRLLPASQTRSTDRTCFSSQDAHYAALSAQHVTFKLTSELSGLYVGHNSGIHSARTC